MELGPRPLGEPVALGALQLVVPSASTVHGSADVQVSGVSAVPLPGTAWLLGSGFVGIAGLLRRRRVSA